MGVGGMAVRSVSLSVRVKGLGGGRNAVPDLKGKRTSWRGTNSLGPLSEILRRIRSDGDP